jgi:hypothetical protein
MISSNLSGRVEIVQTKSFTVEANKILLTIFTPQIQKLVRRLVHTNMY